MRINKILNLLLNLKKREKKDLGKKRKENQEFCMNNEEMMYLKECRIAGIYILIKAVVIFIIQY